MNILAFESSCDETAVAVVRDGRTVLSDAILSQADMHALYGGVVPEIASRKHVEAIAGLTDQALSDAGLTKSDVDAVAVTYAPGLIGAVLVGVSFAKSVAYALGVPLIPVHHVRGHIAANYLAFPELEPPFLALAISGGNTLIVDVRDYTDMAILGATRDDAAGECFDKAARVLGLPYPGGKPMDALAQQSPGGKYPLPRVHVEGAELDMSFSGLKTAVVNLAHNARQKGEPLDAAALARDFTQAVSDELVPRAMEAARLTASQELYGGGMGPAALETFLLAGDGESRALACDNGTFREIVLLYLRSMRRDPDLKAQLLMLCLEGWEAQPEKNAVYMQQMKLILQSCLRSGDPFTQIGAGQYWVLLPGAGSETHSAIAQRLQQAMHQRFAQSSAVFRTRAIDLRGMVHLAEPKD